MAVPLAWSSSIAAMLQLQALVRALTLLQSKSRRDSKLVIPPYVRQVTAASELNFMLLALLSHKNAEFSVGSRRQCVS